MKISLLLAAFAGLALALPIARADQARPGNVGGELRPGLLNLRAGDVELAATPDLRQAARFPADHVVVQFAAPLSPDERAAVTAAGVRLVQYLPTDCYLIDVSQTTPAAVAALPFVARVIELAPDWKIDPDLAAGRLPDYADPQHQAAIAGGAAPVIVTLHPGLEPAARDATLNLIRGIAGVAISGVNVVVGETTIGLTLPWEQLDAVAALDAVQMIEPAPEFTPRLVNERGIVQSGLAGATPLYDRGLTGVGHIIGLVDTTPDLAHCAFLDTESPVGPDHRKFVAFDTPSPGVPEYHGTHVAGILAGNANAPDDTRGIAYGARMSFHSMPTAINETQIFNIFDANRVQGALVHSNSWGNRFTSNYDATCRAVDNFMYTYQDNLLVFATANESTLRNPENAKNVLAVFATGNAGALDTWCSGGRGPTSDGRRKPEVGAPGCNVVAANYFTSCSTVALTGTSMAAPMVSGLATLTREYFQKGFYPSGAPDAGAALTPTGALLRALAINSAVDLANVADAGISTYPSNQEGWGRVIADNALFFAGDARRLIIRDVWNGSGTALTTGAASRVRFSMPPGLVGSAGPLRVTLTFTDAPGAVLTSQPVVNNLNLKIYAPDGSVYLGNTVVNGASVSVAGGATAPDAKNSAEQVIIPAPAALNTRPGMWVAEVSAPAVNSAAAQGFALVLTGPVAEAACPADFNLDGLVDDIDFVLFAQSYDLYNDPRGDLDLDGLTDDTDFVLFTQAYDLFVCP